MENLFYILIGINILIAYKTWISTNLLKDITTNTLDVLAENKTTSSNIEQLLHVTKSIRVGQLLDLDRKYINNNQKNYPNKPKLAAYMDDHSLEQTLEYQRKHSPYYQNLAEIEKYFFEKFERHCDCNVISMGEEQKIKNKK